MKATDSGIKEASAAADMLGQMERQVSSIKGEWLCYYPHALGIILAKEYGKTIEILAVNADNPGTGQLRSFIAGLKESFSEIFVWEVWNPDLRRALERYGFRRTRREEIDETLTGFAWKAPSVPNGNDSSGASSSPKSGAGG